MGAAAASTANIRTFAIAGEKNARGMHASNKMQQ
jgi:hypothetical protein